jgi:multimeric flavodoxin WrbA
LLDAAGFVFAAPENLGGLSGPMKDLLDRAYYPLLERVAGRPYAALICAGSDGTGALRQIERVATGWRLRAAAEAVIARTGAQTPEAIWARKTIAEADLARCAEIGGALGAGLALGVF